MDKTKEGNPHVEWSDFTEPLLKFESRVAGWPKGTSRPDESLKGKFLKPEEESLLPALFQWKREKDANLPHTGMRIEKLKDGMCARHSTSFGSLCVTQMSCD